MAAAKSSSSLQEYLKRYKCDAEDDDKKNKKKKKKPKTTAAAVGGVLVVDEDPVWHKPINPEQEAKQDNDSPDEKPQIDEDIEYKRIKRLEQLRARRSYNQISEDGSGWVPISDLPKPSDAKARCDTPSPDSSPQRPSRTRCYDSPSPERSSKVLDSNGDDDDMSPPRRQKDPSISRDSDFDDLSPPRRGRPRSPKLGQDVESEDLSTPRKSQKGIRSAQHKSSSTDVDLSPPRKPLPKEQLRKTGLITGKDVSNEIAKTKKDELSRFNQMDPSMSGQGAEPVYRFKGERVSKDEYLKLTKKKEEKAKEEKKLEWGKGLAQKREAEAKLLEMELEKEKPFARSRDDPELDRMMKDRVRWGDPMAHLVKKKQSNVLLSDLGENEKMKESGFIIPQDIPSHSWIKRGLDYEPNRYGIKPGRHWDGVNRSNGYEKQMFKRMNEKRATEREAYLWSVSDM